VSVRNYRDLLVWQKAMDLVANCYELTRSFPKEEIYGLTNQIRRAAISIPANIAEGHSRFNKREFVQFIGIATGSLAELETDLLIAVKLNYLDKSRTDPVLEKTDELARMLKGLRNALRPTKLSQSQSLTPKP
jgi:four helix bundle protein